MRNTLLTALLLVLAGCDFTVPLSHTASADANPALAGNWNGQSSDGKPVSLGIKTSGTGYSVTYRENNDALAFKGFDVSADGLNLIQLEQQNEDAKKYLFVKYELTPEGLSVYRLNTEVVSAKCQTSEELLNDIRVHLQNPFLFQEPMTFTRAAL